MNIKIIGLGGVGTSLIDPLCRFLNYRNNDESLTMVLVDGDKYEIHNQTRQVFKVLDNKAVVTYTRMGNTYSNINFEAIDEYVSSDNIAEIIREGDIVFSCVDNHAVRKLISNHIESMNSAVLISGGNEYIDGNVQLYIRKEGKNLTPTLTDYHPEIANPDDKSPEEMSCQELAKSEPQLLFTNMTVATIMCWCFYRMFTTPDIDHTKVSEIYFDIENMSVLAKQRKPLN